MERRNASGRINKIGLALVLLGVAVGTISMIALTKSPVSDMIPRSLELADKEQKIEVTAESDEAATDVEEDEDYDDDHYRRHHHCPGKVILHLAILFFAVFGLVSCVKKTYKKVKKSRRQRDGFRHERMQYFPHPQMHYYAPPQHQPQRPSPYPHFSPYGQAVNP